MGFIRCQKKFAIFFTNPLTNEKQHGIIIVPRKIVHVTQKGQSTRDAFVHDLRDKHRGNAFHGITPLPKLGKEWITEWK